MQPDRIRLAVGPTTGIKILMSVIVLVFISASAGFTLVALGIGQLSQLIQFSPDATTDPFNTAASGFSVVVSAMALCGLPFVAVGLYLLVLTWRGGAWLDGTVVTRRGALLSRSADLATSSVALAGINYTSTQHHGQYTSRTMIRVPALAATPRGASRPVKIALRGQGLDLLPAAQLQALAGALEANRTGEAERARAIATHLRSLATDPLAY